MIDAEEYRRAADFRTALRRFVAQSDAAVRRARLTPQRYLLLLAIKGLRPGEEATMSAIGARLQLAPSSVTGLVDRAEEAGLVRRRGHGDGRVVTLALTAEGERSLERAFIEVRARRAELVEHLQRAQVTADGAL